MIQPRLCIDCRHFRNNLSNFKKCSIRTTHVENKINLVTGKLVEPKLEYASVIRLPHGDCGVEGKLYEFETDPIIRSLKANETVYFMLPSIAVVIVYICIVILKKH